MVTTGLIVDCRARLDDLVAEVAGSDAPELVVGLVLCASILSGRGEWSAAEQAVCRAERALGWRP